jgi:hypothetical protein
MQATVNWNSGLGASAKRFPMMYVGRGQRKGRSKRNSDVTVAAHPFRHRSESQQKSALEQKFCRLAEEWRKETRLLSSVTKMSMHPAYQKIIAIGPGAIPLILRDLQRTRDHWLWALYVLSEEDPAPADSDFGQAVDAWLSWGRERGFIT